MENIYKLIKNKILQDNLMKKIIKNSGIILFGNSAASALNIISFTITANQLGPESLAVLVLAQTYALIMNDIFNIQTWETMIKFGSDAFNDSRIADIIKTNFFLDLGSAIIAFTFALLFVIPITSFLGWDQRYINVIAIYSITILFNITTFTIGIPRLYDKFVAIAKIQVITALLKFGCILYAWYSSKTMFFYINIFLIFDVLTNLLLITFSSMLLNKKIGTNWWKNKIKIDRDQIRFIWWTNLRTIIRIPVRHFDMIVISSVMSIKMVGVYKVYKEIAGLLNRLGDPVNQSIYPEFTKLLGHSDIATTSSVAKKTMLLLCGFSAFITLLVMVMSKYIIEMFFGVEYLVDINALYLILGLYGISFITVPINSLFIAAGFVRYTFLIVLFTNSIYLLTAFTCGKSFGLYGIVIAYAVQLFFNKALKIFLLKKYSGDWGSTIR